MTDATGKVGGKRALDEHGNWIHIKNLSSEVQSKIKANSKKADEARMKKSLGNNKEYVDVQNQKKQDALESDNKELRALVKSQGETLAAINAKMELGAKPTGKTPKAATGTTEAKAAPVTAPKKPTKKQKVMMDAEAAGVDFEETDTIAEIETKISEAATADFDALDDAQQKEA